MVFVVRWSLADVQISYACYDTFSLKFKQFWGCFRYESLWYRVSPIFLRFGGVLTFAMQTIDMRHLTITMPCMWFPGFPEKNTWKVLLTGDVREWRKMLWHCFWVQYSIQKIYPPVKIKHICLRFVTTGWRGHIDIIIQSAIQLAVIKITVHQNVIWMFGS